MIPFIHATFYTEKTRKNFFYGRVVDFKYVSYQIDCKQIKKPINDDITSSICYVKFYSFNHEREKVKCFRCIGRKVRIFIKYKATIFNVMYIKQHQ